MRHAYSILLLFLLICCAADSRAESPNAQVYDLVVIQGTPAGVVMSVRAAREGLSVLLVNHNDHLGGILSSGLGVWDTLYEGKRSPLYDELRQAIFDHYRDTYGPDSPQYREALPGSTGHTNGRFEPRVAEKIFTDIVNQEPGITVLTGFSVVEVERDGAVIRSLTLRNAEDSSDVTINGRVFADCTYEGDLVALAGAPYRVGREAREEFGEPHAGHIFMRRSRDAEDRPDYITDDYMEYHASLNLRSFGHHQLIMPESTFEGDGNVQAFNYRTILTSDPDNRLMVEKPEDYDPEFLATLENFSRVEPLPNDKFGWNRPQLIGPHQAFVEGTLEERQAVMDQHWEVTLALLWYLQNDPGVRDGIRARWRGVGLALDEFADNGHRPYEIYVREARRIEGLATFTQHDATLHPDFRRAPIHTDSIAFTEWYLDSHGVTLDTVEGSMHEGKMMLHYETWPGQVSYRTLLPRGMDNLIVPVCLSSTHVAWGTIRLEPTWMQIAESAALAVVQAIRLDKTLPGVDSDKLVRELARRRSMISFFNDIAVEQPDEWITAALYFGTKGFFSDYNVRPDENLDRATAAMWIDGVQRLQSGELDPHFLARALEATRRTHTSSITSAEFARLLGMDQHIGENALTRGEALEWLWRVVNE